MMQLVFEVAGDKQINREILRVGAYAADAAPAFVAIGELLITETKQQFDTQGGHASGGWKPLKPATLAEKARRGMRMEILQETGALMRSLTQKDGNDQIFEVRPDSLTFGSRLPYAGYHQTGTRRGLPRRPPLELTETARRAAVKILQRWIITGELA